MTQKKLKISKLSSADIKTLQQLTVGSLVDLQIATPTAPKRVKTHFVGIDFPNSMVFQMPSESRWGYLRDILSVSTDVVIRFVLEADEGKVIAFKSSVLKIISQPSQLFFIQLPSSLEVLSLRQHKRWSPGIQVKLTITHAEQELATESMIVDVSLQGCRCVVESTPDFPQLKSDTPVQIQLAHNPNAKLKGVVKNCSTAATRQFYGIQFSMSVALVKKMLNNFIVEL